MRPVLFFTGTSDSGLRPSPHPYARRIPMPATPRQSAARLSMSDESYGKLSIRPLHILVFLAPLMVLYEIGLVVYLSSSDGTFRETIRAHETLSRFFEQFGQSSLYLPGIALAVVLIVWHIASRDRWKVRWGVAAGMGFESALWMVPLLVFGLVMSMDLNGHPKPAMMPAGLAAGFSGESWQARATLSVGAGLYEELLFRLLLVTGLHALFFDLLKLKETPACILAVVGSAVAFTIYHDVSYFGGTPFHTVLFYTVAGGYFGVVFLLRGFGIVVGTHAAYDIMVLVVMPLLRGSH